MYVDYEQLDTFRRNDARDRWVSIERENVMMNREFASMLFIAWTWDDERVKIFFNVNNISHQSWVYNDIFISWIAQWHAIMMTINNVESNSSNVKEQSSDRENRSDRDDDVVETVRRTAARWEERRRLNDCEYKVATDLSSLVIDKWMIFDFDVWALHE